MKMSAAGKKIDFEKLTSNALTNFKMTDVVLFTKLHAADRQYGQAAWTAL